MTRIFVHHDFAILSQSAEKCSRLENAMPPSYFGLMSTQVYMTSVVSCRNLASRRTHADLDFIVLPALHAAFVI